jgi:hypothetical protein
MSNLNGSDIALITDNSFKSKNGNLLNIQSVVLDKILDDPQTQEVVVMEVCFTISIKLFFKFKTIF